MVIEAYSGFTKKPNSTKQPSGSGTQLNVILKENTSVLHPTFLVHGYSFSHNYIKWGSRYYFIDDIISISNDMAEYVCSTDVMATYKTDIGNSTQYVTRSATSYNPYAIDTKYPAQAESHLEKTVLTGLQSNIDSTGFYVLGTISDSASGGVVTYYAVDPDKFTQIMTDLFTSTILNASDITVELQKELVNPCQYIISCFYYPLKRTSISGITNWEKIKFGWWETDSLAGYRLDESNRIFSIDDTFSLSRHPQQTRGIYLNDAPFTRYTLECYSFGSIPLDPSPFVGNNAGAINIDIDLFTGLASMYVAAQGARILKTVSQFGVPVQLAQNSSDVIGGSLAALGGAVGLAYGNYVGFAQGIASAVESMMPQVQSKGANGSKIDFIQTPTIVGEFRNLVEEDLAQIGRPLCAAKVISTLSGFIQCEGADLDTPASPSEKSDIISNMNGGFYYE